MNIKRRSFVAGAVGMLVAFGIVELAHGLYQLVPSVLVAVAQRIIELTPGDFATTAVAALGKANIPILVAFTMLGTLAIAGFLTYLSLRSRNFALVGMGILAAVALAAAFTEPFIDPVATVLTVLGALGIGASVSFYLLRASGLLESGTATEAAGVAAVAGLAAGGAGRLLSTEEGTAVAGAAAPLQPSQRGGGAGSSGSETLPEV